MIKQVKENI